ncbi:MAG: hypothetical protein EXS38_05115 [Opitutus sp.]|nr:hypothetical protein [Opitutus sp.]
MDPAKLMAHPLIVLVILDAGLVVLLGLRMSSIYPFVRFRAALGLGLVGFMFYAQGQPTPLLEVAVGAAGLYLSTVFVKVIPAIVAALAGVGGMGMLAWFSLSN